jgi:hypothetical protein
MTQPGWTHKGTVPLFVQIIRWAMRAELRRR